MRLEPTLRPALRVLSLRRPLAAPDGAGATAPPVPLILTWALVGLVLQGLASFLQNGLPGHLEWTVLPDLLFPLLVLWLSCWAVGVLLGAPRNPLQLFTTLLAARSLLLLGEALLQVPGYWLRDSALLDTVVDRSLDVLHLWWLLAVLTHIAKLAPVPRGRLLLAWGAFAGPALLTLLLFPPTDLWQADASAADEVPAGAAMSEEAFYSQGALFDDALDAIQAERPGVDDLYFLGFAGDAGTPAIRNEVELAERLLAERFDTRGRSLLLINDDGPRPRHPFATRTNLDAALAHLGQVLDADDDILLLFLSSHGTPENTLALSQPALTLDDIEPAALRRSLDEAGIRWRIVIVSACYSGGFVDALREEHTLVITASDATHPSFGCGVSDRYTWFGEAFFDQALRRTLSLPEAFRAARARIAEREHSLGETPSNPQLFVGAAMSAKLAALQARLSQPGGPASSVQAMRQAGMSGVSWQASRTISSFKRSLRFFSRRRPSSSRSPATQ